MEFAKFDVQLGDYYWSDEHGWGTVVQVSSHRTWCLVNYEFEPDCFEQIPIEEVGNKSDDSVVIVKKVG